MGAENSKRDDKGRVENGIRYASREKDLAVARKLFKKYRGLFEMLEECDATGKIDRDD